MLKIVSNEITFLSGFGIIIAKVNTLHPTVASNGELASKNELHQRMVLKYQKNLDVIIKHRRICQGTIGNQTVCSNITQKFSSLFSTTPT